MRSHILWNLYRKFTMKRKQQGVTGSKVLHFHFSTLESKAKWEHVSLSCVHVADSYEPIRRTRHHFRRTDSESCVTPASVISRGAGSLDWLTDLHLTSTPGNVSFYLQTINISFKSEIFTCTGCFGIFVSRICWTIVCTFNDALSTAKVIWVKHRVRNGVLEKQTSAQLVNKFAVFYRTRQFITVFTTAGQFDPIHTPYLH
jgi:hypothetical protein